MREHCSLSTSLTATSDDDKAFEIAELIADEVALVQAYTTAWRGNGTVEGAQPKHVEDTLRAETAQRILPWPNISETPVFESSDGRIVRAHPLVFPTGCGDLRQPRLRTDFRLSTGHSTCSVILMDVLFPLYEVSVQCGHALIQHYYSCHDGADPCFISNPDVTLFQKQLTRTSRHAS